MSKSVFKSAAKELLTGSYDKVVFFINEDNTPAGKVSHLALLFHMSPIMSVNFTGRTITSGQKQTWPHT